ncbi:hypothetical protein SESBI_01390 [Sesbania bispinosa]|nr:hypothetical protein SESBI_01390 [Sesbania bispinosa]
MLPVQPGRGSQREGRSSEKTIAVIDRAREGRPLSEKRCTRRPPFVGEGNAVVCERRSTSGADSAAEDFRRWVAGEMVVAGSPSPLGCDSFGASKKTLNSSNVPVAADKSETKNVQVKATVKDVGLDEMQVGSSQGLGVVGPETIHVGGSGGLGGVGPETMHVVGSEGVGGVGPDTMHVEGTMNIRELGDGQRDVGPDNVAAGGSEGVRDVGPKIVAAGGNEGVTDVGPKTVRDVGPIVVDASNEGVRDAEAQNVEYDEVEPDIMQNMPNTKETVAGSESSDDSERGVHFEDSEEERALGADDSFMHPEVGQIEAELNDKVRMMKEKQAGGRGGISKRGGRGGGQNRGQNYGGNAEGFAPPDMENMHIMEEDYETEELHNDAEFSDGEGGTKPRFYKRTNYELCYGQVIAPINGAKLWPKTGGELILPPSYKPSAGTPKKLRRREPDEPQNPTRLRRGGNTTRCGGCQNLGHNSRSCTTPPVNPTPEP